MTPPEPVIVPIDRRRAFLLGGFLVVVTLGFVIIAIAAIWVGGFGAAPQLLALLGIVATGPIGVGMIAMSIRNPVALRMDSEGISGYYADPARWGDIARIGASTNTKGHRYLGFALINPVQFFDRQSPWRRFLSWSNGRGSGYHIVVPGTILRGMDLDELAAQAQAFHKAASENPAPHNDVS